MNISDNQNYENNKVIENSNKVKIPKKRGRKPRIRTKEELEAQKIPKKRGRKPKIKIDTEENINKFILPSKRGRKPKEKTYSLSNKSSLDNLYILHLPISYEKVKYYFNDEPFLYNPNLELPNAFDPYRINENLLTENDILEEDNNLCRFKNDNTSGNENINTKLLDDNNDNIDDNFSAKMLLKFSEYSKKYNSLPDDTTNKCYWCLHNFNNKVFGLPLKIVENKFEMYGCFCSPECVTSFNFEELKDEFVWERYSYINYLYNDSDIKIYPAPSRFVLNIFGGELTIEQFRNITEKKYNGNILLPPLISIIPQLEIYKINDNTIKNFNTLKLKRDKPLTDKKNNLEESLKLVYI